MSVYENTLWKCFLSKNSGSIHLGNKKETISFLNPAVNINEGSGIFPAFPLHRLSLPFSTQSVSLLIFFFSCSFVSQSAQTGLQPTWMFRLPTDTDQISGITSDSSANLVLTILARCVCICRWYSTFFLQAVLNMHDFTELHQRFELFWFQHVRRCPIYVIWQLFNPGWRSWMHIKPPLFKWLLLA